MTIPDCRSCPADRLYRGRDSQAVLCDECATKLFDPPDMPWVGQQMWARLVRLKDAETER